VILETSLGLFDDMASLWDASARADVRDPLNGHIGWVKSVTFSHDDSRIVFESHGGTACIWDASTSAEVCDPLAGHTDWINSVAFSDQSSLSSNRECKNTNEWLLLVLIQRLSPLIFRSAGFCCVDIQTISAAGSRGDVEALFCDHSQIRSSHILSLSSCLLNEDDTGDGVSATRRDCRPKRDTFPGIFPKH